MVQMKYGQESRGDVVGAEGTVVDVVVTVANAMCRSFWK